MKNKLTLMMIPVCLGWGWFMYLLIVGYDNYLDNHKFEQEVVNGNEKTSHKDTLEIYEYSDGSSGSLKYQPKHIDAWEKY